MNDTHAFYPRLAGWLTGAAALVLIAVLATHAHAGNVVIVVIDGARYTETLGAESTYVPRMWNILRRAGMVWTNFRNDGVTSTNPGHASIATGTYQTIANDGTQRPTMPTVFEYYREAAGATATDAYVVVGKPKLDVLSHSVHPEYGAAYAATVSGGVGDEGVFAAIRTAMTTHHPRLMMVNFPDVDAAGHSGNRTSYLAAIHKVDSLVNELWTTIQSDPFYQDSTTLVVTNDHGRHDDVHGGFTHHGDACEGCRHLMLLAVGRAIPPGRSVSVTRTQWDIAMTVGALMNFPVTLSRGTSLLRDAVKSAGESKSGVVRPPTFRLDQNYPEQFNPTTPIGFRTTESGRVALVVYDILGAEVALPVNDRKTPGTYIVGFNAGGPASGTTMYGLTAGNSVSTRRMTVLN